MVILMRKNYVITRNFEGVVKPELSNKVVSNEKITLLKQGNIVDINKKTRYHNGQNINGPLMQAIIEHRLHPSIIIIKEKMCLKFLF